MHKCLKKSKSGHHIKRCLSANGFLTESSTFPTDEQPFIVIIVKTTIVRKARVQSEEKANEAYWPSNKRPSSQTAPEYSEHKAMTQKCDQHFLNKWCLCASCPAWGGQITDGSCWRADLGELAGFGHIRGRSLGTLWYLLIRSNIWIQSKDALQINLRQKHNRDLCQYY